MTNIRNSLTALACVLLVLLGAADASATPSAELFVPEQELTVDIWTNASAPWFLYPEQSPSSNYFMPALAERPNLGVSLSGGGYRAMTLALGYVRALHIMGVLHKARYMSSNSGASWFSAAFSFQEQVAVSDFLGPFIPPEKLSKQVLQGVQADKGKQHGEFAAAITDARIRAKATAGGLLNAFGSSSGASVSKAGGWSMAVGEAFLAPFNLSDTESTFSARGTMGPINTGQQLGLPTYYYNGGRDALNNNTPRPFPIMLGSMNNPHNPSLHYPVEFTPLYCGIPGVFEEEGDSGSPQNAGAGAGEAASPGIIGGGFVEPLGFNTHPPSPPPALPAALVAVNANASSSSSRGSRRLMSQTRSNVTTTDTVEGPSTASTAKGPSTQAALNQLLPVKARVKSAGVTPLKVAVGISSQAIAAAVAVLPARNEKLKTLVGTERAEYWSPVSFQGGSRDFSDGGLTDNYALTPLLRRKVQLIVACIANTYPLTEGVTADKLATSMADVSGFFGAERVQGAADIIQGLTAEERNERMQVFPIDGWPALVKGLLDSTASGGPTHHLAEYTVLDNTFYAVHGGWKVKVLWVWNARQSAWEDKLPLEVKVLLDAARDKGGSAGAALEAIAAGLKGYPYISTMNAAYSPELAGLLSQQATWQMMQLQPQLEALLGSNNKYNTPAGATPQGAAGAGAGTATGTTAGPQTGGTASPGGPPGSRVSTESGERSPEVDKGHAVGPSTSSSGGGAGGACGQWWRQLLAAGAGALLLLCM